MKPIKAPLGVGQGRGGVEMIFVPHLVGGLN